jgi:DNA polymerase-4
VDRRPKRRATELRTAGRGAWSRPELDQLTIAHLDCDAFYASVEKRDRPELRDRPVIVGGGKRGVVSTCCYVARQYGVHSAMPMFKALKACPDAVVIKPDFRKYVFESRAHLRLRRRADAAGPDPVAGRGLDRPGGHRAAERRPARLQLIRLQKRIEDETGLTVSIGLAPNRFLAKMASEMDKPRGFSVVSARAQAMLAPSGHASCPASGRCSARPCRATASPPSATWRPPT